MGKVAKEMTLEKVMELIRSNSKRYALGQKETVELVLIEDPTENLNRTESLYEILAT